MRYIYFQRHINKCHTQQWKLHAKNFQAITTIKFGDVPNLVRGSGSFFPPPIFISLSLVRIVTLTHIPFPSLHHLQDEATWAGRGRQLDSTIDPGNYL